jgi:hypothetical protein
MVDGIVFLGMLVWRTDMVSDCRSLVRVLRYCDNTRRQSRVIENKQHVVDDERAK